MSAVPSLKPLGDEELELLGSRYLDGDLSPEERAEFETYLERHPEANAKLSSLQAVVEEYRSLPGPDTPFALSTRIAARVQDQAVGFSGVLLRLGIVRRMGAVFVLMAGLGVVAIYYLATLGGSPEQVAARRKPTGEYVPEKDIEGPVQVFFEEKPQPGESAKVAEQASRPAEPSPVQVASAEPDRGPAPSAAGLAGRDEDAARAAGSGAASEPVAIIAQAAEKQPEAKEERTRDQREAESVVAGAVAPAAPAPAAPAPAIVADAAGARSEDKSVAMRSATARKADEGLAAVAAPPAAAPAVVGAPTAQAGAPGRMAANEAALSKGKKRQGPVVSVTGPGGRAAEWRMAPASELPPLAPGSKALFHVVLDPDGRVKKVIRISGPASGLDEWVKRARFEKAAGGPAASELEVRVESLPE
ncbi:MAG: hypothetical protein L6R30_13215 [Thermoanaerobaculia bacterium]|nr:hypothetical protein [Thermoanaerobaculia bacterium]